MAWRARRSHVETIDKVASLEKLCLLIGYQIRDMGEARGRVVIHPTSDLLDFFYLFFLFVIT